MKPSANVTQEYDKQALLQTIHLTKTYGKNRGVQDINLTLQPGETYGFLGPNGAGKTTTIRCMLDLLRPTSGAAYAFGTHIEGRSAYLRTQIGYVAGEVRLIEKYTGAEHVSLVEGLRGQKAPHVDELRQRFGVDLTRKIGTLSKGNKQKVALLLAFMFDNALYILDEPTSGLDPLNQQQVFQLVNERRVRGATILLSSHILSEVEHSCERVGIVSAGRLLAQESMKDLINRQLRHITLTFQEPIVNPTFWNSLDGITNPRWDAPNVFKASLRPGNLNQLMHAISQHSMADVEIEKASLEDVFMNYYDIDQSNTQVSTSQIAALEERGA